MRDILPFVLGMMTTAIHRATVGQRAEQHLGGGGEVRRAADPAPRLS
jgi:hypothetical protein